MNANELDHIEQVYRGNRGRWTRIWYSLSGKRVLDGGESEFPIPALKQELLAIFGIRTSDQGCTQSVKIGTRTGSGYQNWYLFSAKTCSRHGIDFWRISEPVSECFKRPEPVPESEPKFFKALVSKSEAGMYGPVPGPESDSDPEPEPGIH